VQSFWRDEAFSVIFAQQPVSTIVFKSLMEPPVYYLLLHFWIKIFGTSEIAARSLSLVGFTMATIVIIEWADKLFKSHWLSKFLPIFFFFNPMLLYYAFEVRAYGWYIFFATLALFAYDQKRWNIYRFAVILGIYTHLYLGIIPLVHFIYEFIEHRMWKQWNKPLRLLTNPMIQSLIIIGFCFIPWAIRLSTELQKFKDSWYFPVNINLIQSVLGNMFLGYEGTPWYLWGWTRILSFILFNFFGIAIIPKEHRKTTIPMVMMIFIPLSLVIGFSFYKPIFVNRYLIPVTIAEVILLTYSLKVFTQPLIQKILAIFMLVFVLAFDCWYPQQHPKLAIRETFQEINRFKSPQDIVLASDAMIFMETLYYTNDKKSVKLYNPMNSPFPWYIGDAVFSPSYQIQILPHYPARAFFINTDGTYSIRYNLSIKQ
jgi:uncharacterized membrane protein